ncbi:hypothetical protein BUL40_04155 [Croceivirga radicis]|uniref:DUF6089 domain-containing protein n=1 Tax=Croceivirga radicis TaxID=1929488 RepID=A0A1V6LUI6_9FLAO|nr:DUF6089 family protein [Croceivirga radicis]OQD43809.1 hypothetical protein BUL40_04155 [Croceivirga radicis]
MRKIFFVIILCFGIWGQAQTYEAGLFAGGANTITDVGSTNYIVPTGVAFGGLFKWNKAKRFAYRGSVYHGKVVMDDSKSNMASREQRGYRVENKITEYSAGLEFNFVEYNLHKLGPAFTPYLYTGLTYFRYDFNYIDAQQVQDINQKDGSFAIPMTIGAKYRLNQFLILGVEIGARYTFTDNLDASNPEGSNFDEFKFGNILSDDWYVFSGFTLTYTFGRKPCQDCFE